LPSFSKAPQHPLAGGAEFDPQGRSHFRIREVLEIMQHQRLAIAAAEGAERFFQDDPTLAARFIVRRGGLIILLPRAAAGFAALNPPGHVRRRAVEPAAILACPINKRALEATRENNLLAHVPGDFRLLRPAQGSAEDERLIFAHQHGESVLVLRIRPFRIEGWNRPWS
jgi:hypothetical protein